MAEAKDVAQSRTGTDNITLADTLVHVNTALAEHNAVTYQGNLAYVGTDTLHMLTTDGGQP